MKVLFVGDIVGSSGRQIVSDLLADIVQTRQIDLVIANGENAASGFGITPRLADDLFEAGVEVLTGGNHIWDRKEILDYFPNQPRLLRPANFADINPGSGLYVGAARNGVSPGAGRRVAQTGASRELAGRLVCRAGAGW